MKTAYIGCRTTVARNSRGKGLRVCRIEDTGEWKEIQLMSGLENPSYLAFDNEKKFLYTVHGDCTQISSFSINPDDGTLSLVNTAQAGGRNPVFLSVDRTNRFLFVATLQGGTVCTLERRADGSLSDPIFAQRLAGKKPDGHSFAHQCIQDRTGEFIFVPAQGRGIGYGQIDVFQIAGSGELVLRQTLFSRPYDEPRHAAVHPNNRYVYLINERGNCVTFLVFDAQKKALDARQIVSTLPETYTGEGQASAILVHPSGKFVYASNRIHDSIAVYSADEQTGYLKIIGFSPSLGKTPRFMTFSPEGDKLFVANEDSDTIQEFLVDTENGVLTFSGRTIFSESPVCILFR